jgi:hypothetical protein
MTTNMGEPIRQYHRGSKSPKPGEVDFKISLALTIVLNLQTVGTRAQIKTLNTAIALSYLCPIPTTMSTQVET